VALVQTSISGVIWNDKVSSTQYVRHCLFASKTDFAPEPIRAPR
jgi:hypothetical protein